jgi:hypothetical protein
MTYHDLSSTSWLIQRDNEIEIDKVAYDKHRSFPAIDDFSFSRKHAEKQNHASQKRRDDVDGVV